MTGGRKARSFGRPASEAVAASVPVGVAGTEGRRETVELDGPDVRGIAVHIGARVASLTGPSEVLVISTVKDLVAYLVGTV
jgi:hypothetical protein